MLIQIISNLILPIILTLSMSLLFKKTPLLQSITLAIVVTYVGLMSIEYIYTSRQFFAITEFSNKAILRIFFEATIFVILSYLINIYFLGKSKKFRIYRFYTLTTLLLITAMISYFSWFTFVMGEQNVDQILNNLAVPVNSGAESFKRDMFAIFFPMIIVSISLITIIYSRHYTENIKWNNRKSVSFFNRISIRVIPLSIVIALLIQGSQIFKVADIIKAYSESSMFFEKNYVNPISQNIVFPDKKKNLIVIVLESIETSFFDSSIGGSNQENLMPNLAGKSQEPTSVNFSSNNKLGGMIPMPGTYQSVPGLSSMMSGIPYKAPQYENTGYAPVFLPGMTNLGDILHENGYKQRFIQGMPATPYGIRSFFESHGKYEVYDNDTFKELGYIPEDYHVGWGIEDKKLFELTKESIIDLSEGNQPFNLVVATMDTHAHDGYVDASCPAPYSIPITNAVACVDSFFIDFIDWLQNQSFYEDTTVLITGDHLTQDKKYIEYVDKEYERTTYNVFLNAHWPDFDPTYIKNRQYGAYDMFPTILTSLGVKFDGNRLGIGTDLTSGKPTIIEQLYIISTYFIYFA